VGSWSSALSRTSITALRACVAKRQAASNGAASWPSISPADAAARNAGSVCVVAGPDPVPVGELQQLDRPFDVGQATAPQLEMCRRIAHGQPLGVHPALSRGSRCGRRPARRPPVTHRVISSVNRAPRDASPTAKRARSSRLRLPRR